MPREPRTRPFSLGPTLRAVVVGDGDLDYEGIADALADLWSPEELLATLEAREWPWTGTLADDRATP